MNTAFVCVKALIHLTFAWSRSHRQVAQEHLSCRYENEFEKGVLANTNVGGENCHRGAAIGALLGARNGESGIPAWMKEGLQDSAAIREEIDAFVSSLQSCHV